MVISPIHLIMENEDASKNLPPLPPNNPNPPLLPLGNPIAPLLPNNTNPPLFPLSTPPPPLPPKNPPLFTLSTPSQNKPDAADRELLPARSLRSALVAHYWKRSNDIPIPTWFFALLMVFLSIILFVIKQRISNGVGLLWVVSGLILQSVFISRVLVNIFSGTIVTAELRSSLQDAMARGDLAFKKQIHLLEDAILLVITLLFFCYECTPCSGCCICVWL
ncbi:hypothetical protein CASFOL_035112 [Castilleja foliolosa]|uniref:Reticulon-like protein n=1 Tax=Castilleja foliolosa TaxID=1961234 RepID=A0ABD3BU14_9LAMI